MPSGYENVAGGARYPANLISIFMGWPDWSPTARGLFTRPPTGKYFSPALPSDCFAIDLPGRAISPSEGPLIFFTSLGGSGQGCPSLRASNAPHPSQRSFQACSHLPLGTAPVLVPLRPSSEHILIVRAPGARDQHGCHSTPFTVRVLRPRRAPDRSRSTLPRPRVQRYK
jgi:hypothetical protein